MREVSLRIDRYLVNTRITPNQLTYLMTVCGVLAAPALLVPGVWGAVLGVVAVQLYLLLDCVDGEIARWRKQYSLGGVYLDRVGAYLTDAAVLVGLGLRAADLWGTGPHRLAVGVPRHPGRPRRHPDQGRDRPGGRRPAPERDAPGQGGRLRDPLLRHGAGPPAAGALKFHRLILGIEASLLILVLAIVDQARGDLFFTRLGTAVLAGIALLQTLLHLVSILASSRLK
ncbi:CDP-alcohol phosphatidyltransferase family protein OS=Streptomyces tendae OX=1932 GN=GUR47_02600 PE=4 SV=1 [Streptomyces tendae]